MRPRRVMVRFSAGRPTWESGSPETQPEWAAHAAFIDELVDRGTIVMGGPFSDYAGAMLIFEGVSSEEARGIVHHDPFVQNGVFQLEEIRDWTVYVDALTTSSSQVEP